MRQSYVAFVSVLLLPILLPVSCTAQDGAREPSARAMSAVDGRLLAPSVDSTYAVMQGASGADTIGFAVQSLARTAEAPGQWLQVYRWEGRDGSRALDSLAMDATTLRPLWQARYTDVGQVRVAYRDRTVRAEITPSAGEPIAFDSVYQATVYSSSAVDALARALPLAPDASASLDLYYPYPAPLGLQRVELRVIGSERLAGSGGSEEECWVVAAALPGGETRMWIGKATRALIQTAVGEGPYVIVFRR